MNILLEDFHDFLDLCFAGDAPVLVQSLPGSGKSKGLEAYAKAQGPDYGYFELDLAKANIADLQGYLMPTPENHIGADGQPIDIMAGKFTYPHFLYDKFTKKPAFMYKRGVVVFEEWGQGDGEVKRASAPMIYDRRLGLWEFKEFDVVMLSNRPEDRSGVTKEYDFIINRRVEVTLIPTLKGFLEAAHKLAITPLTMAFAARNEDKLFGNVKVPDRQGPWLTQRSLHKLDDILKAAIAKGTDLNSPLVLAAASGCVGEGAAHTYMAFAKARHEIPTLSSIIADPDHAPIPDKLDVLMFLVFDLASKTTRENIKQLVRYVKRIPSDFGVTYFHAATRKDKTLVSTAEFSAFAIDNLTLLSAVAARKS